MNHLIASLLLVACVLGASGAAVAEGGTSATLDANCHDGQICVAGTCLTNVSLLLSDREAWVQSCMDPI